MQVIDPSSSTTSRLRNIGFLLLFAYIMVLPIGHTTALRNVLFFSLIALTIWLAWRGEIRVCVPIIKPWLLYSGVAFFSLTYAVDPWYSLKEIKTEIGFGFLAMVLGATWIRTAKHFSLLIWALVACNAFLVFHSFYSAYPILIQGGYLQVGSFNIGVGKFSTLIITILPLIVAQLYLVSRQNLYLRLFLFLLILGNISALYFTGNRTGLAALMIEIIVLILIALKYQITSYWRLKTWAILSLSILLIGSLAIKQAGNRATDPGDVSSSISKDGRWEIWTLSLSNIKALPFSGSGFGLEAFKLQNPEFVSTNPAMWHSHNTLLNIGVQTGLPGIFSFIVLITAALIKVSSPLRHIKEWNANRIYSLAGVVMFSGLIFKLQTDDFFYRDIALLFWTIVGSMSFIENWAPRITRRFV